MVNCVRYIFTKSYQKMKLLESLSILFVISRIEDVFYFCFISGGFYVIEQNEKKKKAVISYI